MSPLNREFGLTSHFGVLVSQNQQAEKGLPVPAGAPDPEVGGWPLLPPHRRRESARRRRGSRTEAKGKRQEPNPGRTTDDPTL